MRVIISPILLAGRLGLLIEIITWQLSFGHNGQALVTFLGLYPFEIFLVQLLKAIYEDRWRANSHCFASIVASNKSILYSFNQKKRKEKGIQLLLTICPGIIVTTSAYRAANCYCLQIGPTHGSCLFHHRFILAPKWVVTCSSFKPTSKNTKLGLRFFLEKTIWFILLINKKSFIWLILFYFI